jgi:hypothetical protein
VLQVNLIRICTDHSIGSAAEWKSRCETALPYLNNNSVFTMLEVDASSMGGQAKPVARLLQHAILQLCNEHVAYNNKLQILGVLCLTVDDEQHDIVVKVNNTLKRVNPPTIVTPIYQPDAAPTALSIALPHAHHNGGTVRVPVAASAAHDGALSLSIQNVASLANASSGAVRPVFVGEQLQLGGASLRQENDGRQSSPDVIVVDKDTDELVEQTTTSGMSSSKTSGRRRKTTPMKARNFDDETNPLFDEDVTTILPVDPDEIVSEAGASPVPLKRSMFVESSRKHPLEAVKGSVVGTSKRRSKTPQHEQSFRTSTPQQLTAVNMSSVFNGMTTIRALLTADTGGQAGTNNSQKIAVNLDSSSSHLLPAMFNGTHFAVQPVLTIDLSSVRDTRSPSSTNGPDLNVPVTVEDMKLDASNPNGRTSAVGEDEAGMQIPADSEPIYAGGFYEEDDGSSEMSGATAADLRKSAQRNFDSNMQDDEDQPLSLVHRQSQPAAKVKSEKVRKRKKVKDIVLLDEGAATTFSDSKSLLRFDTDTSDFMMDQLGTGELGSSTRRRRRRGPVH